MTVIGITGPSGAGKGVASAFLQKNNIHVIDADAVYHDCITPPSDCLDELVRHFGRHILTGAGFLNRSALASMVFGEENKEKLLLLNQITHKYVVARIRRIIAGLKAAGAEACAIDAPLLIEAGLVADCNLVIAILADPAIRASRIAKRDGIEADMARARIGSQKSDDYYVAQSQISIYNNTDTESLLSELAKALSERGMDLAY